MIKYGLALSGGGANGAFHVGALIALHEMGIKFCAVSGVSVGALVGALANSPGKMERMWKMFEGNPRRAFTPYFTNYDNDFSFWRTAINLPKVINGKINSIANNAPAIEVMRSFITEEDIPENFTVSFVSMGDGKLYTVGINDFYCFDDFFQAIIASTTSIPFFPPVENVKMKKKTVYNCADGGLRMVSPGMVVDCTDKYTVIAINCRNDELAPKKAPFNILQSVIRADEIKQTEIFRNDMEYLGGIVIQPDPNNYIPSQYDFGRESMDYMMKLGYNKAKEEVKRWQAL